MNDEIILKFYSEYDFNRVIDEIYHIVASVGDPRVTEEIKELLLQFQENIE